MHCRKHHHYRHHRHHHRQRDLDPAVRPLACNLPGVAVGHDLVGLAAIGVAHQPHRHQRVLEGAALVVRLHAQVALGVAGHLARAQLAHGGVHFLHVELGGAAQVDLVALHRPAAHEFGRVRLEVGGGGEGLDLAQQGGVHADGAGHEGVVEEVRELARGRLPAHMAHLAGLGVAVGVAVGFGGVVIKAGLGLPAGLHMGVKRPVGQVQALEGVGERGALELARGEPARAIPLADFVADLAVADLEGQDALRRDGVVALLVGDDGGRAAEVAALGRAAIDKDRDGPAVLALHFMALGPPAAAAFGGLQGGGQVLLDDFVAQGFTLRVAPGHARAAIRALQRLGARAPFEVGAAFGARVLAHEGGWGRCWRGGVARLAGGGRGGGFWGHDQGSERGRQRSRQGAGKGQAGVSRADSRRARLVQCASGCQSCAP